MPKCQKSDSAVSKYQAKKHQDLSSFSGERFNLSVKSNNFFFTFKNMWIKLWQDSVKLKTQKVSLNWKHFKIDLSVRFGGNICFLLIEAIGMSIIDYVNCTQEIFQYFERVSSLVLCNSEKVSFHFWRQHLLASLLLS